MLSCAGSRETANITRSVMEYGKHSTKSNLLDLTKDDAQLIDQQQKSNAVQPGVYADYGVALALMGKNSEANRMFNREEAMFPNSKRYVRQLKLQLVPEYISDTVCDTSTVFVELSDVEVEPKAVVPLSPEEEKALKKQQREAAKQKAAQDKKEAQKLKKQMQKEKEKEKKVKEKEKKQAKKAAEKQKKEAKKDKDRQRKEAQKQKEQQRKEQQQMREQQREDAKLAKEQQREENRRQKND